MIRQHVSIYESLSLSIIIHYSGTPLIQDGDRQDRPPSHAGDPGPSAPPRGEGVWGGTLNDVLIVLNKTALNLL